MKMKHMKAIVIHFGWCCSKWNWEDDVWFKGEYFKPQKKVVATTRFLIDEVEEEEQDDNQYNGDNRWDYDYLEGKYDVD